MKFSSIPGLKHTKNLLTEAVKNNHTAHAQLFAGGEGALNLPLALAYATYLHCQARTSDDACGVCSACSKNLKFIHPDTHFVFPVSNVKGDKDEERFKAEITKAWRSFLLEQPYGNIDDWTSFYGGEDKQALISRDESREIIKTLSFKPFESPFKVMVIWQPELMHPSAANGILKILEEPAAHTYFLLVTNAADKLLPTIISRTQIISVPLLEDAEIENELVGHGINQVKARKIANLAEGNLSFALRSVDTQEDDNATRFIEWMRACFKKSYKNLVTIAENYHAMDKLSQKNMMGYGMNMLRETLLARSGASAITRLDGEELKFIQDFSKVMSVEKIDKSFILMNEASYHMERNGSSKMIFLDLSLKLTKIINP
jgi:DNA polymerase III subunit delta'